MGSSESDKSVVASLAEDFLGVLLLGKAFQAIGGDESFASVSCLSLQHSEMS